MHYNSFRPGKEWLDTDGKLIQAHGGSVIYANGTFYWYGENKEKTKPDNDIWHWGVRCYSSQDLYNWKDEGIIIPPNTEDPESSLYPSVCMDRPHILYNKKTGKYVCWLKIMEKDGTQDMTVLISDKILGPYTMVKEHFRPFEMSAGDFDLDTDEDGKGYYYFEKVHTELICAELSEDYTGSGERYTKHFEYGQPPYVREAPAHFVRNGKHYLITSGTTGYHPNPSEAAAADDWHGPWKVLGDPHQEDKTLTSFNSQISCVFKHPEKQDLYIAMADRWLPNLPEEAGDKFYTGDAYRDTAKIFKRMFLPDNGEKQEDVNYGKDNTSISRYVWLPIYFHGEVPYIEWKDEWRIED